MLDVVSDGKQQLVYNTAGVCARVKLYELMSIISNVKRFFG